MPRDAVYRADPAEIEAPFDETAAAAPSAASEEDAADFDIASSGQDERLRPTRIDQVVGQKAVVDRVRIMLEAARKRDDTLGHILLDGPPGLGKTTLANVVATEMEAEIQITAGPSLSAPKDLLPYLTAAGERSVLFIDEIHRLPPPVEEFLYPAMEDYRIDFTLGEGINARTMNMPLKRFTVIGATTRAGLLTGPLRDRFVYREHLEFYDDDELIEIIRRNATKLRTTITDDAAAEVARRSQGTPRKANNLLLRLRDFATVETGGRISSELADRALGMLEIDALGLERQDRRYLETLIEIFAGGPAGLSAIAHSMSVPTDTLEDDIEPYLLRSGLVQRTRQGRVATPTAWEHLGRSRPTESGQLF